MNRLNLSAAVLLAMAGTACCVAEPPTPDTCRILRKHGHGIEATNCFETLSRSDDPYLRARAFWGLQQYDQANEAFRTAVASPASKPLYRVQWGLLLHERFNSKDSVDLFHEALAQGPIERAGLLRACACKQ